MAESWQNAAVKCYFCTKLQSMTCSMSLQNAASFLEPLQAITHTPRKSAVVAAVYHRSRSGDFLYSINTRDGDKYRRWRWQTDVFDDQCPWCHDVTHLNNLPISVLATCNHCPPTSIIPQSSWCFRTIKNVKSWHRRCHLHLAFKQTVCPTNSCVSKV